jgi:phage shock protein A
MSRSFAVLSARLVTLREKQADVRDALARRIKEKQELEAKLFPLREQISEYRRKAEEARLSAQWAEERLDAVAEESAVLTRRSAAYDSDIQAVKKQMETAE